MPLITVQYTSHRHAPSLKADIASAVIDARPRYLEADSQRRQYATVLLNCSSASVRAHRRAVTSPPTWSTRGDSGSRPCRGRCPVASTRGPR